MHLKSENGGEKGGQNITSYRPTYGVIWSGQQKGFDSGFARGRFVGPSGRRGKIVNKQVNKLSSKQTSSQPTIMFRDL